MADEKTKVLGTVKINVYEVISRAVEEGVRLGWTRAHKHTDKPEKDTACSTIAEQVVDSLSEVLDTRGDDD